MKGVREVFSLSGWSSAPEIGLSLGLVPSVSSQTSLTMFTKWFNYCETGELACHRWSLKRYSPRQFAHMNAFRPSGWRHSLANPHVSVDRKGFHVSELAREYRFSDHRMAGKFPRFRIMNHL